MNKARNKRNARKLILILSLIFCGLIGISQTSVSSEIDTTITDEGYCVQTTINAFDKNEMLIDRIKQVRCFYSDGVLKEQYAVLFNGNMNGIYEAYFPNGQLQVKYQVIHGRKSGLYIEYYSDGQIKKKGLYAKLPNSLIPPVTCDTTEVFNPYDQITESVVSCETKSSKTGTWYYYNKAGDLIESKHY